MEWYSVNNQGVYEFHTTMKISNVNTANWTAEQKNGIWMAITFSGNGYEKTDVIGCALTMTTNRDKDNFSCSDSKITGLLFIPNGDKI